MGERSPIVSNDEDRTTPQLLTAGEVADFLRCTPRTLRRWERAGRLKPLRIGRNLRYREADVWRVFDRELADRIERSLIGRSDKTTDPVKVKSADLEAIEMSEENTVT